MSSHAAIALDHGSEKQGLNRFKSGFAAVFSQMKPPSQNEMALDRLLKKHLTPVAAQPTPIPVRKLDEKTLAQLIADQIEQALDRRDVMAKEASLNAAQRLSRGLRLR